MEHWRTGRLAAHHHAAVGRMAAEAVGEISGASRRLEEVHGSVVCEEEEVDVYS